MANKNNENKEENKDAKIFIWGIIVAIVGSLFTSSIFATLSSLFSKADLLITIFYMGTFIGLSMAFWQVSKLALKQIGIKKELWIFDIATLLFLAIGVISLALYLQFIR
jgi:amino acid transporter